MSVDLYSGTPGSGKSLHSAADICKALKRGKYVIANFPIEMDYFKKKGKLPSSLGEFHYIPNGDLSVSYLKRFSREHFPPFREHQGLLVVDECGCIFNPRSFDRKDRQDWITFFSQHRKLGYDVILISQSDRLIDKQMRSMIETEYRHRALKNYKLFGFLLSFLFGGLFFINQYWYGCHLKLSSDMFRLNKKQAKIYDTFKIFDSDEKVEKPKIVTVGEEETEDGNVGEEKAAS